ncbi:hypothetical protein QBC47DRAFT_459453 [Echria macrotheca]|uniref:Uncharacterized protein n=1 Tax=Echria macrotheca TaxID=438768 RepID=A0AAJ0BED0_9PEZI|nr:hypothetical protein QBC47DRAFT_459453 [Echria macrotheca]
MSLLRSFSYPRRSARPASHSAASSPGSQWDEFRDWRAHQAALPGPTPLPLPDVEDLTDCESDVSEEPTNSAITRPTRAFFLGIRASRLITPHDLESGRFSAAHAARNGSSDTLVDDDLVYDEKPKSKAKDQELLPEADPFETYGLDRSPLPPKKGSRLYRYLRWNFGSVYRRIFCLSFFGNMFALCFLVVNGLVHGGSMLTYQQAGLAVTANILAAMVVRNEHIVNAMFWVFGTWSNRLPYWARKLVAKVYSYGGIHSGCAVAGTFWYIAFLVLLTVNMQSQSSLSVIDSWIYFVSYFIVFLLVSMCITAHPRIRVLVHNWFEGIHRYMGWLSVLLFWAQNVLLAVASTQGTSANVGHALLVSPNFWMLIIITLLVIYPWSRMRLRDVEAEVLSEHCVKLNFNYRDVHYGQAIRLTDAPLSETHAFGVIPHPVAPKPATHCDGCMCHHSVSSQQPDLTMSPALLSSTGMLDRPSNRSSAKVTIPDKTNKPAPPANKNETPSGLSHAGERGFSVIVSNAGDWTKKIIRDPPKRIYTRGTPQFGVMRVAGLFEPCIIVATGSGIAPCLSLFVQKPDHPVRIVWSTRSPLETYGQAVLDLLYRVDPRAVIIDTTKPANKRPDLVKIVYRVWEQSRNETPASYPGLEGRRNTSGRAKSVGQCEAVVIISNQKVTKKVVYGLESRGVPAYGAIFDS